MVRSLPLNSGPNRYSEGVIRSPALASATDVETYLTPIPSNPNSYVVSTEIRPNPEVLYRVNLDQFFGANSRLLGSSQCECPSEFHLSHL